MDYYAKKYRSPAFTTECLLRSKRTICSTWLRSCLDGLSAPHSIQGSTASLASLGLRTSRLVTKAFHEGLEDYYRAMNQSEGEHEETDRLRQEYNRVINSLLQEYDVLLLLISLVLAIPHIQQAVPGRILEVNGRATGHNEHLIWDILATVIGLPATILPLNRFNGEFTLWNPDHQWASRIISRTESKRRAPLRCSSSTSSKRS